MRSTLKDSSPRLSAAVDYYVAPLFASTKGAGMTFNMLDRLADAPGISRVIGKTEQLEFRTTGD